MGCLRTTGLASSLSHTNTSTDASTTIKDMLKRELVDYGDPATLQAGGGSIIELVLGVPDIDIPNLASSQDNADAWVRNNVIRYTKVRFRYIAVGNEEKPADPFASAFFSAIQNLHNSISAAGLRNRTKVTTATIAGALGDKAKYPPFQYPNIFVAMSDAFYSALERAGGGSLEIVLSESGWPSAGGGPEPTLIMQEFTAQTWFN
ncbi:glucan endo-1,3-beta-glucosidase, basic isoform-like [Populus trichocarpa]|uniref:glucan endo-1,3-beta-glucosidase, basic isoform-like n=1 Tax=Populus trichocarpa TaxID=3694 RepID=UPI0022774A8A|nr:glucan endo-1,3-beta-glucosidase, basic isoform-like [Populus trichocarpa]